MLCSTTSWNAIDLITLILWFILHFVSPYPKRYRFHAVLKKFSCNWLQVSPYTWYSSLPRKKCACRKKSTITVYMAKVSLLYLFFKAENRQSVFLSGKPVFWWHWSKTHRENWSSISSLITLHVVVICLVVRTYFASSLYFWNSAINECKISNWKYRIVTVSTYTFFVQHILDQLGWKWCTQINSYAVKCTIFFRTEEVSTLLAFFVHRFFEGIVVLEQVVPFWSAQVNQGAPPAGRGSSSALPPSLTTGCGGGSIGGGGASPKLLSPFDKFQGVVCRRTDSNLLTENCSRL